MGRCRNCLLTSFRVCQFIFSLVALACGAYITYLMYNLASLAQDLELALTIAMKSSNGKVVDDALQTLSKGLLPPLQYLQSTPIRAIVLSVVSLVSIVVIVYLFFARRSKRHPSLDRQWVRVTLEILVLLAWLGGVSCAALLTLQYGALALTGGLAVKTAMGLSRKLLEKKLEDIATEKASMKNALDALDMFGNLVTIAVMSIASTIAAAICLNASFVSLIVACCSKTRKTDFEEHGAPMSTTQPLDSHIDSHLDDKTPKSTFMEKIPRTRQKEQTLSTSYISDPTAPWPPQAYETRYREGYHFRAQRTRQSPQPAQSWRPLSEQKWHPPEKPGSLPMPFTPPTPYTGKPTPYMAFAGSQEEPFHYSDNTQYDGAERWAK